MSQTVKNTLKNISRNKWLSVATVLVSTIVFTTASFFISVSLLAQRAVEVSETKAQLQIYFKTDAPEEEVLFLQEKLEQEPGVDEVEYISQAEALEIYTEFYSEEPDLVESIGQDWLPASLEVRAKSLEELESVTKFVKNEKEVNVYIEEVIYQKDVVDQIKLISRSISTGALTIIAIFSVITVALVVISIAFNIHSHKNEIEIMHLVGSADKYIRRPFILEGVVYTTLGAFIAASLLIIPWYAFITSQPDVNFYFIAREILKELDLNYLLSVDSTFVTLFYGAHIVVGALIGFLSSSFAVMRNLNLKKR